MFSKPKAPDTSKQEALLAKQELDIKQREDDTKRRDAAAQNARRGRATARSSLITGGNEVGVVSRETLG